MGDGYWRYAAADSRQGPPPTAAGGGGAGAVAPQPALSLKRPRPDYADSPGGPEIAGYYSRDEGRAGYRAVRDNDALNSSYDRYLRTEIANYGAVEPARPLGGGTAGYPVDDRHVVGVGGIESRYGGYGGGRTEPPLPPNASSTLFIEGLPANCTRREVSHIFRPFVGFREVRLVNKESRHPGEDPFVLCFVDFSSPAQAAVALEALQGYKFDEDDRESANLRLQFARNPGPRSSGGPGGPRGRR